MKEKMIIGIALAMGMLSVGAVSASATESCCSSGKCTDTQAVRKFTQETTALSGVLKAKDIELREQYSYDGIDMHRVSDLESELNELKGKIRVVAEKYGISTCCLS